MSNNDDFQKNFVILLNLFKDRPHHLAKYLTTNSAFSNEFITKILNSSKLNNIRLSDSDVKSIYMTDISQMNDYFNSFLDDVEHLEKHSSKEEVAREVNAKLDELIVEDRFEEAAQLRDYMNRNGIKRLK